jgi:hypothetical protein
MIAAKLLSIFVEIYKTHIGAKFIHWRDSLSAWLGDFSFRRGFPQKGRNLLNRSHLFFNHLVGDLNSLPVKLILFCLPDRLTCCFDMGNDFFLQKIPRNRCYGV